MNKITLNKIDLVKGEFSLKTSVGRLQLDLYQQLLPDTKFLVLTHLTSNNLHFLQQNTNQQVSIWLSYEMLALLQKMKRFGLFNSQQQTFRILPPGYPQPFGDCFLTAWYNDDSLFGSIALLIKQEQQKIGYCRQFSLGGLHKKQISRWKKNFKQAGIQRLLLDPTMTSKQSNNHLTEDGLLHHWEKQLNRQPKMFTAYFSPWALPRLERYVSLCQAHRRPLFLSQPFGQLLEWIAPQKYHWSSQQSPAAWEACRQNNGIWQNSSPQLLTKKNLEWSDPSINVKTFTGNWCFAGLQPLITTLTEKAISSWQQELAAEIYLL
jgi:hypothetical protein